jgi:AAA family ATP:ADP antiporter
MTLINTVTVVFALSFVLFWALYQNAVPIGVPFFLWLGIFNMLVVAQFWSLANELFSPAQGKRLFPIIAIGGALGAIAGSWVAKLLIGWIGVGNIMLIAAWLLGICIALTVIGAASAKQVLRDTDEVEATDEDVPLGKEGGFRLIANVRYLRLIAAMVIVYNIVNTTGEYILGKVVTERATLDAAGDEAVAEQIIGELYGGFFTWVNALAAVLQIAVVGRVVKYIGVRAALLVLPVIALGGYTMIAVVPMLLAIKIAKIVENGTDYSLHNTVRQMLWLPTSAEAKYKAKSAVDAFCVRLGDVLAAGVVAIGTLLALTPRLFAAVNVAAVVLWLALAWLVGREHDRQPRAVTSDDRRSARVVRGKYVRVPA